jgi:hypothetical protein
MSDSVGHTAFMGRAVATWRIRERRTDRRRGRVDELKVAAFQFVASLFWAAMMVLAVVFDSTDGVGDVGGVVCGGAVVLVGLVGSGAWGWDSLRASRAWTDRVWLDDTDLWWVRQHPRQPEPVTGAGTGLRALP